MQKLKEILLSGNVNYWTGEECRNFEKEFTHLRIQIRNSSAMEQFRSSLLWAGIGLETE